MGDFNGRSIGCFVVVVCVCACVYLRRKIAVVRGELPRTTAISSLQGNRMHLSFLREYATYLPT